MIRSNVTATEARCAVCLDTASKSQRMDGDLDCNQCDATDKRLALRKHLAQFTAYPDQDVAAWAAYLFAQRLAVAEGVLRDYVEPEPVGTFLRITDAYGETWLHQRGEVDDAAVDLFAAPVAAQPVGAVPEMMPVKEADQLIELAAAIEQVWLENAILEMRAIKYREGPFKDGWNCALEEIEVRCNLAAPVAGSATPSGDMEHDAKLIPDGYRLVRLQQRAYETPRGAIYGGTRAKGVTPLYVIADEVKGS